MAHINFNHLNASTFNSFVPEATITSNQQLLKNALIVSGFILLICVISIKMNEKKYNLKENEINS